MEELQDLRIYRCGSGDRESHFAEAERVPERLEHHLLCHLQRMAHLRSDVLAGLTDLHYGLADLEKPLGELALLVGPIGQLRHYPRVELLPYSRHPEEYVRLTVLEVPKDGVQALGEPGLAPQVDLAHVAGHPLGDVGEWQVRQPPSALVVRP